MKKILAFTMAEVLVVMGIIGVVAAITIPTLNNTSNQKETVAKVNKAASDITEAYGRARAKYGRYNLFTKGEGGNANRLFEFMNVKNCSYPAPGTTIKNLVDATSVPLNGYYCYTSDGMQFHYYGSIANATLPSGTAGVITVDIDGHGNGYDTIGVDVFYFLLSTDGGLNTSDSNLSSPKNKWWKYANYILQTGKADYLNN